jgi:hypothetical protein
VTGASGSAAAAEALLRVLEQQRRVELAAAALAEDAADEARGGDHVRDLPVLGPLRLPDRDVLAGHLQRIHACLGDVAVDAGHVVRHVVLELDTRSAVDLVREVVLALEVLLPVRRDLPLAVVLSPVGGAAAGKRSELRATGVPQRVHREEAVLGADVAEPEHRRCARLAVDVRHAEGAVADDGHVVVARRRVDPLGAVLLHAERRVLEVLRDVGPAEPGGGVDQVAVHLQLVG